MFRLKIYVPFLIYLFIISVKSILIYTQEEVIALEEFRSSVNDVLIYDYQKIDSYLIRWLRAQNLNINAANQMLRKTLQWRKHNQIDTILNETLQNGFNFPDSIDGIDKAGSPILTYSVGKQDFRKYFLHGKKNQLLRYQIQINEKLEFKARNESSRTGKDISQVIFLGDASGYNPRQHGCVECVAYAIELDKLMEMYYPGFRKLNILINVPRSYELFLNTIRPVLSLETKKALKVFGRNKTEWSSFLLEYISSEQLDIQFGGTKKYMKL